MAVVVRDAPGVRMELELLCCLSPRPRKLAGVAADLGVGPKEMRRLVEALKDMGHDVRVSRAERHGNRPVPGVAPDQLVIWLGKSWEASCAPAESYWDAVHGESD